MLFQENIEYPEGYKGRNTHPSLHFPLVQDPESLDRGERDQGAVAFSQFGNLSANFELSLILDSGSAFQ